MARTYEGCRGLSLPGKKILTLPGRMCWTQFKKFGPISVNNIRFRCCPNLVSACQLCLLQFNSNVDFKNIKTNYRQPVSIRSGKITKLPMKRQHCPCCSSFQRSGRQYHRSPTSLLAAISNHSLATLPAKMSAFKRYMRQNA